MPLSYRDVSQPDSEPVSLIEAKQHLRVDFDDDDSLILGYIAAARQYCERLMDRAIFQRSMRLTLDTFPLPSFDGTVGTTTKDVYLDWYCRELIIRLPKPATISVESITYRDNDGTTKTLDPSYYVVDVTSEPARIAPAPGHTWPALQNYVPGQVVIDYTAGTYDEDNCPWTIKAAILLVLGHLYANREQTTETALKTLPLGVDELLAGERFETIYGAF